MRVVANATPIIVLAKIDKLELLEKLYSEIMIPKEVFREIVEYGKDKPDIYLIKNIRWIKLIEIQGRLSAEMLQSDLDPGESEVIILAKELSADLVLIDDLIARKIADLQGLNVTGTIGVLIEAKGRKLIQEVKPILDEMVEKGFRLSEKMYKKILLEIHEE